jgi:uncharacterized protein YjiS (DUF1127 family)
MTTTAIRLPTLTTPLLAGLTQRAIAWRRRRATRRQLESLTLDQLRDVGIDPDVVSRGHDVPGDPWMMSRLMSLR